ncbi:MAG: aldehyde dehydrogenase family protein [Candidatus Shapirobacteria bacterium]|jgi:acyl-CoA reductase-like NAD-dependent aldehyde dehydrogenase
MTNNTIISTNEEIIQKVNQAQKAKKLWKELSVENRNKYFKKIIELIVENKKDLATLQSKEIGMPISQSIADVEDAVRYSQWYVDYVLEYLSPQKTYEDDKIYHQVFHEPYGVTAVITPWNFPISNFVWGVMQNLVVGNVAVFKHSEECSLFGKKLEEIVSQANLPEGVFSEIYGNGQVGDFLVHQNIDLIWFTGSTKVGQSLYKIAAEKFIKAVFELGGSSPGIIFADADVDNTLETIFSNRFYNCGQVCDGLKRLIVHQSRYDEIIEKLKKLIQSKKVGNALDPTTDIGPLVAKRQLDLLKEQFQDAINKGANVECGGKEIVNLDGFFFEPTILTNISPNMKIWHEEVFGPILPVVPFQTEEEAVKLANDTKYGLGSYIFTEDKELAKKIASQIEAGMVGINNAYYGQPGSPFGGQKLSGMGRSHGTFGFHDLTQIKVVAFEK